MPKMNALMSLRGNAVMANLTVRNLPDEIHRALRVRAARHGRSTEAEIREILMMAVKPEGHLRLGDALAQMNRELGLTNEDVAALEELLDRSPAEPMRFE